jgi:hypothetical protein
MLSEDQALRDLLLNITVSDQKTKGVDTPRQVGVWFGQPDQELREQRYPYIVIDMIDVTRDQSREMRGKVKPDYIASPTQMTGSEAWNPDLHDWKIDRPIPVNLDYQITTYSRHPRHDRELLAKVLYDKLPFRFGTLNCDDSTVRRLDVLDVTKRDVTEQAKRLFVNAITVRVSSEIAQGMLQQLYKVLEVRIDPPTETNAGGRESDPTYLGVESVITSIQIGTPS